MTSIPSHNPYRSLLAHSSLLPVFVLLLAACGTTSAGPTPPPGPSFATQAEAYLEQKVAIETFSGTM